MNFPPEAWDVFHIEDFELPELRDPGRRGVEVMAQLRNNGRIMDHFRFTLGGSEMLEANFKLSQVMVNDNLPDWEVNQRLWPWDVKL